MASHPVDISAPLSLAIEITRADQVGDDALGSALGDVQLGGHISDAYLWVARNEQEQIAVVRKEPEFWDDAQGVGSYSRLGRCFHLRDTQYPKPMRRCINRGISNGDYKSWV